MRKFVIVGAILVAVIVVLVVVATNLNTLVNKNKGAILARAESSLGREVSIGSIGITLRRGLGVRLEGLTVGEDPAFGAEPFVTASELQVNVKILPLLKKEFQVNRIVLRNPVIRIVKNKSGELNTLSLARHAPAGSAEPQGNAPAEGEPAPGAAAAVPLVVSLANIENGEVKYIDETQGLEIRVQKIETSVKDFDLEKPLSLELEAALFSDERNLKARGTVGPLPKPGSAEENTPPSVPVNVEATIDPLELTSLFSALPRLSQSVPKDVRMTGPVSARVKAKGMSTDLEITVDIDGTRVELTGPQGFTKTPDVPLTAAIHGRLAPQKFVIENSTVKFAAAEVEGTGEYTMSKPPTLLLDIRSEDIDLAGWDKMVPAAAPYQLSGKARLAARVQGDLAPGSKLPVSGTVTVMDASATAPQLLNRLTAIQSEIAFSEDRADIRKASLQIGGSRIEGRAAVEKFKPMTIDYEATSPSLALADLKAPQPSVKKAEHLDGLVAKGRLTVDPVSKLSSGGGTIASNAGSIANVDYTALASNYGVEGKTIRIESMSAKALEGEVHGSGVITSGETGSNFDLQVNADKVDVTELLTALPGSVHKSLRGMASLNLKIAGSGKEWPDVQKSLKGAGLAELVDGEILDVNFASAIFDEIGKYVGSANLVPASLKAKYPAVFENKNTSFDNLKSDFAIENGKLLARNLHLKHNDYGILAKGSLGFDRSLDIGATFVVSKKLADDLARSYPAASYLKNPRGEIELPLVLSGAIPNVDVRPDAAYFKSLVEKGVMQKGLDVLKNDYLKNILPTEKKPAAPPDTAKSR
jgi:uncharacterized protein involved in outer membrane biogenesis